jgi:hypothetical protein
LLHHKSQSAGSNIENMPEKKKLPALQQTACHEPFNGGVINA